MEWTDAKYGDPATPEQINTVAHGVISVEQALDSKVDKVSGKQLSTNDFNDDYKSQLDNLNTELANKADAGNVLTKDNTTAFTPVSDYQPATKKYVDDSVRQAAEAEYITDADGNRYILGIDSNGLYLEEVI